MMDVHELVLARIESDRRKQAILTVLSRADVSLWAVNQAHETVMLEGTLGWDMDAVAQAARSSETSRDAEGPLTGKLCPMAMKTLQNVLDGRSLLETSEHQVEDRWYRTRLVADLEHSTTNKDGKSIVQSALGFTIDVTDVKARATLQIENERLMANEHAAKEASGLKSQFLANVRRLPLQSY